MKPVKKENGNLETPVRKVVRKSQHKDSERNNGYENSSAFKNQISAASASLTAGYLKVIPAASIFSEEQRAL